MQNKPADHYFMKLNQLPLPVRQILNNIREIDEQVLKLHNSVQASRKQFLDRLIEYEENKAIQKNNQKQIPQKRLKSEFKGKKILKSKSLKTNLSLQKLLIKNGGTQRIPSNQQNSSREKQELTKLYINIDKLQRKILNLSEEKVELSEKLYNFVHQVTEDIEKNISIHFPIQEQLNLNGYKPKKNKKNKGEEFVMSQPKYCYCRRPSFGLMVECSNQNCQHEWFHKECMQNYVEDKQWYCKDCINYFTKTKKS